MGKSITKEHIGVHTYIPLYKYTKTHLPQQATLRAEKNVRFHSVILRFHTNICQYD